MATQQNPSQAMSLQLVIKVIYVYIIAFSIALPALAFYLFPPAEGEVRNFALQNLFPNMSDSINIALYAIGLMSLILGFALPKLIGTKGTASIVSAMAAGQLKTTDPVAQAFSPYIIRLVFFEFTTLCGFICAFWGKNPLFALPLATLGIFAVLISPPRRSLLEALVSNTSQQPGTVK